jgi:hypothetical protein
MISPFGSEGRGLVGAEQKGRKINTNEALFLGARKIRTFFDVIPGLRQMNSKIPEFGT